MQPSTVATALLITAHGSPTSLEDLPAFLANIRRGRPTPPEVVHEVRRRYEAIGGQSPLDAITRAQADALGKRLDMPAHVAMRLWKPYPVDVLREVLAAGARRIVSVPIAPYSTHVYHASVREALTQLDPTVALVEVAPWNTEPALLGALATEVAHALDAAPREARTLLVLTAHSLPERAVKAGDPYPRLVEATARGVINALARPDVVWQLAYQSQGMSSETWLGPDLPTTFRDAKARGFSHVVIAPIGFLADHVEVLYDIDQEAVELARHEGLTLSRTRTLNDASGLIDALESAVRTALPS